MTTETNNTKPLYKALNEERTRGEYTLRSKYSFEIEGGSNEAIYINAGNIHHLMEVYGDDKETHATAAYTVLAVNNLASLAEALETVLARLATFTESSAWEPEDQDAFDIGTAALSSIS